MTTIFGQPERTMLELNTHSTTIGYPNTTFSTLVLLGQRNVVSTSPTLYPRPYMLCMLRIEEHVQKFLLAWQGQTKICTPPLGQAKHVTHVTISGQFRLVYGDPL